MKSKTAALAACMAFMAMSAPVATLAQDGAGGTPHEAEVAVAAATGARLFAYDQAAWHDTDRFLADLEDNGRYDRSWLRGFLVLEGEDGQLDLVFYGEEAGEWLVAARYAIAGDAVTGGGLLEGAAREPLSPAALRMVEARNTAFAGMADNDYRMCADANPNTVIFPPDEAGEITVYVLTPMVASDAYPLGGHYRFTIAPAGSIRESRRFLNSCFNVPAAMPGGPQGARPVGVFVTHLLDEYPTEVHFFASRYVPLSLLVGTVENDLMWTIDAGLLESVSDMPDTGS